MKTFHIPAFALLAGLFAGCSSTPRVRPINSINEPVFHAGNYASMGLAMGKGLSNGADYSWMRDRSFIYSRKTLAWNYNSTKWASFSVIPIYWSFLLTGEQYADSLHLIPRKLHATLHGGVNGFSYSQRSEWAFPADLGLGAKYLFNQRSYLTADAAYNLFHILDSRQDYVLLRLACGYQATSANALELSYQYAYFRMGDHSSSTKNLVVHRNGDSNTELFLNHYYSIGGRHVLGPEIGWGSKNLRIGSDTYYMAGLTYRYVFR